MRRLLLLACLGLATALPAPGQSGPPPSSTPDSPPTVAQAPVADAGGSTVTCGPPLRRLHNGRTWSLFHFARRPPTPSTAAPGVGARTAVEFRRQLRRGAR